MAYELGPVIGQLGGGTEVITEQVTVGEGETRTFNLPEGWEEGYVGAVGDIHIATGHRTINVLGAVYAGRNSLTFHGFDALPSQITTDALASWSGTVTMIRTA